MNAEIHGASIHYDMHGAGSPAVLFVHGFPLSGTMWTSAAEAIKDKHRAILPDMRGLGRSGGAENVSMAQWADDLAALLDHIGETKAVVVVGLSMGGYITLEFFRRHRNRVRALGLIDTRHLADPPAKATERGVLADKVMAEGSTLIADGMVPHLFAKETSQSIKDEWHKVMSDAPPKGVAAALRAMAVRADSTPTLAQIDVPTLIVCGEHDVITPPKDSREMNGMIAGSELHIIPGAGHMTPVEKPAEFNAILRKFLERLP